MFGAELGNFHTGVGTVDNVLLYAFHFVAEYKGIFSVQPDRQVFERGGILRLFDGKDPVTFCFQLFHYVAGFFDVFPFYGVFCP